MTFVLAVLAAIAFTGGAVAAESQPPSCDVPDRLIPAENDLTHVGAEVKDRHRLDITVVGSGSSALAGPDGARFAYPAQLEQALKERLPGVEIKVTAHVPSRQTTADMAAAMPKILADDHPALVIWQAGTVDALRGVEPEDFRNSLDQGLDAIAAAGADVVMMNMQYSPRTKFDAQRRSVRGCHALGGRAARRLAVRPPRHHALLERRRNFRPLCGNDGLCYGPSCS